MEQLFPKDKQNTDIVRFVAFLSFFQNKEVLGLFFYFPENSSDWVLTISFHFDFLTPKLSGDYTGLERHITFFMGRLEVIQASLINARFCEMIN